MFSKCWQRIVMLYAGMAEWTNAQDLRKRIWQSGQMRRTQKLFKLSCPLVGFAGSNPAIRIYLPIV